jgi:hypothetical protein
MRGKSTLASPAEDSTICRWLSPTLNRLNSVFGLELWICHNADVTGTKALLSTLKSEVESYLGTNICFASLVHDDPGSHADEVAQDALQALGLSQVMGTIRAATSVIHAHMPAEEPPKFDEEPWVVVALDYSSHWFNVGLYTIEEEGILSFVDDFVGGPEVGEENQLAALENRLRGIIASPPPGIDFPQPVRYMWVYGDDAKNEALKPLLATILGEDLLENARVVDSIYTGLFDVADSCHFLMSIDLQIYEKAAFGCKLRSKLYREEKTEL